MNDPQLLPIVFRTSGFTVRIADEMDMDAIASVFSENESTLRLLGPDVAPRVSAAELLHHDNLPPNGDARREQSYLIVDSANFKPVGVLVTYAGYPTPETLFIGSLFIRPAWQGRGVGREVMIALEQLARECGFRRMGAAVGLKNWRALRFWVERGFNQITRISGDTEFGENNFANIRLEKDLTGESPNVV